MSFVEGESFLFFSRS